MKVMGRDQIEAAIANAERTVPIVQLQLKLSTGRPFSLLVPADVTVDETIELIGYICTQMPKTIADTVTGRSSLVAATGPLPRA